MSDFIKVTEQNSAYNDLEKMSTFELLKSINTEDKSVAFAVEKIIPNIEIVVNEIVEKLKYGGRLFYIGAGTSGRLGVLDASELPPTYGVTNDLVIAIIAGGNKAITIAVENAEDDVMQSWKDLQEYNITEKDIIIGISASGTTPYVISALQKCMDKNIVTACITCNDNSPLSKVSNYAIEIIVGSEFVTGSTRMKSGTAQKMVLNMISTSAMIKLGRVVNNKMVNMQLVNDKLVERGILMILEKKPHLNYEVAKKLLEEFGSVTLALQNC